jgi:hypothetical protein
MSIEAIRSAFMAVGKGVVRLTHAGLAYKDSHQVSHLRGLARRRHAVRAGDGAVRRSPGFAHFFVELSRGSLFVFLLWRFHRLSGLARWCVRLVGMGL